MTASDVEPTRYVFVPLNVKGPGLLATIRTTPGPIGEAAPYANAMSILNLRGSKPRQPPELVRRRSSAGVRSQSSVEADSSTLFGSGQKAYQNGNRLQAAQRLASRRR